MRWTTRTNVWIINQMQHVSRGGRRQVPQARRSGLSACLVGSLVRTRSPKSPQTDHSFRRLCHCGKDVALAANTTLPSDAIVPPAHEASALSDQHILCEVCALAPVVSRTTGDGWAGRIRSHCSIFHSSVCEYSRSRLVDMR